MAVVAYMCESIVYGKRLTRKLFKRVKLFNETSNDDHTHNILVSLRCLTKKKHTHKVHIFRVQLSAPSDRFAVPLIVRYYMMMLFY